MEPESSSEPGSCLHQPAMRTAPTHPPMSTSSCLPRPVSSSLSSGCCPPSENQPSLLSASHHPLAHSHAGSSALTALMPASPRTRWSCRCSGKCPVGGPGLQGDGRRAAAAAAWCLPALHGVAGLQTHVGPCLSPAVPYGYSLLRPCKQSGAASKLTSSCSGHGATQ